jgi:hypothetical protein
MWEEQEADASADERCEGALSESCSQAQPLAARHGRKQIAWFPWFYM